MSHLSIPVGSRTSFSTKATWRQVLALKSPVLSRECPVHTNPSSGTRFHSLQATSHALHPMQTDVSVKNPMRGRTSAPNVKCPSAVFTVQHLHVRSLAPDRRIGTCAGIFRAALFVVPPLAFFGTRRICSELKEREWSEVEPSVARE
jgi:hypothetical protein